MSDWKKCWKKQIEVEYRDVEGEKEEITTREGKLFGYKDKDYVIRGINGEIYPIGREIFEKTYSTTKETPTSYSYFGIIMLVLGLFVGFGLCYLWFSSVLFDAVKGDAYYSPYFKVWKLEYNNVAHNYNNDLMGNWTTNLSSAGYSVYLVGGTAENINYARDVCIYENATQMLVSCANPFTTKCAFSCYR